MRLITQIVNCREVIYALCADGTLWKRYPGISTNNHATGERTIIEEPAWQQIPHIPER